MSLIWFATNNEATVSDLPDLEPFGIRLLGRSASPVIVYRDPASDRLLADIGRISVWKDGRVRIRPFYDSPDEAIDALVRTALDCHERALHRRDDWPYYRATAKRQGHWTTTISVSPPEGMSVFEAHADVLRPAHRAPSAEDHFAERRETEVQA